MLDLGSNHLTVAYLAPQTSFNCLTALLADLK